MRRILNGLYAMVMPPPDAFIGPAPSKFDANGNITDEATRKFLVDHMKNFETWIGRMKKAAS